MQERRNFLFTGVTSGIGYCLVDEVAKYLEGDNVHFCVTCRNMEKGKYLKESLLEKYPSIRITLIDLDVGSIKSVMHASKKIREKFDWLDCLYFNAGIMPTEDISLTDALKETLNLNIIEAIRTGHGLVKTRHHINSEGVNNVFATNVLGHFALIQQLFPLLVRENGCSGGENFSRIIWTSSTSACRKEFDPIDFTGNNGFNAYGSSKYVLEAVSNELNKRYNEQNIYSYVCDPGTVLTNITGALLPLWVWYICTPIIWLMRSILPNWTFTPHNACQSLLSILRHHPTDLNPYTRYSSRTNVFGRNYISTLELLISESSSIYQQTTLLYEKVLSKVESNTS